ncbi:hypothetical protein GCL60_16840 (plasmid) [Silvanigrella paludirubra]|uniref:Uncharacterized protein n=1 Tax=Silvanigrella paludirubra TaxID=2499159 RepID=A0A6N6VMF0_9BACT|nr:hypothetical protein [Silvanigrella paludirubra]KAB8035614.1 hypothetical protein GCL60_16840 [Silvanigrella paludirubra]
MNSEKEVSKIYSKIKLISNVDLQSEMSKSVDFKSLNMSGIQYFSVAFKLHDSPVTKTFACDTGWFKFLNSDDFLSQYFLKEDKIWREVYRFACRCRKDNVGIQKTLLYSTFDYTSKFYNEILLRRKKFELKNGVMFLNNHKEFSTCLTFSSNHRHFSELNFAVKQNQIMQNALWQVLNCIEDLSIVSEKNEII